MSICIYGFFEQDSRLERQAFTFVAYLLGAALMPNTIQSADLAQQQPCVEEARWLISPEVPSFCMCGHTCFGLPSLFY